jgi:hypothetical protein
MRLVIFFLALVFPLVVAKDTQGKHVKNEGVEQHFWLKGSRALGNVLKDAVAQNTADIVIIKENPCSVAKDEITGVSTITCVDTEVTVPDGADGNSCSVSKIGTMTTITCDSTFATVLDGVIGPQGNVGPQGLQGVEGPAGNLKIRRLQCNEVFTNKKNN